MILWFLEGAKEQEDYDNIIKLFCTKELMNRGKIKIGNYYFTIIEQEKTYIVTIDDYKKRKIVNSIFNKRWFEINVLNRILSYI